MSAVDGHIDATITQVGGSDEVWYNPGDHRYYLAAEKMTTDGKATSPSTPVVGVIDALTNSWIKNVAVGLAPLDGFHTIAVDPRNNRVFIPCKQAGLVALQID
jgi:hypothetical protein